MTKEEYEMIENIINLDIENGNIEDLKKLKVLIQSKLNTKDNEFSIEENKEILLQNLWEFITANLSLETKGRVKKFDLTVAIGKYKCIGSPSSLKVYHALGVPKEYLLRQRGCGKCSIEILENMLNKYGLSLSLKLSDEQIKQLDSMNEEIKKLF